MAIEVGVQASVVVNLGGELVACGMGGVKLIRVRLVAVFYDRVVKQEGIILVDRLTAMPSMASVWKEMWYWSLSKSL